LNLISVEVFILFLFHEKKVIQCLDNFCSG